MMLRFVHSRYLGALLMCAALSGCLRQEALYPTVVPIPVTNADFYVVPVSTEALPEKPQAETPKQAQDVPVNDAESHAQPQSQPQSENQPQAEPKPQLQIQAPPPNQPQEASVPAPPSTRFSGFHSYFINREVKSDNIKMFPRWTDMLARYNAEAHTLDAICGSEQYSTCKLKEWKEFLDGLRNDSLPQQLDAVNRFLNKYPYIDDIVNWGFDNYWETPYEFQRKSGNCKDYAIAKFMSLRALGVPNDAMRIEVVRDLNLGGIIHAVLVVSIDQKGYMLDNQIKQVVPTAKVYHYVPIYSINEQHWWQHFALE